MKNGPYELVIAPEDYPGKKYRGRYIYEHHLVWWRAHHEIISGDMQIHHKNENKRDNRLENLELLSLREHQAHHGEELKRKYRPQITCTVCGKLFSMKGNIYRQKLKNQTSFRCSKSCQVKDQWIQRRKIDPG